MVGDSETIYNLFASQSELRREMVLTLPFRRCLSTSRLSNSSCRFCKTDCHSDNAWLRSLWLKGEWMSVEIVTGAGGAGPLVW